jgi:Fur family ferric uptake transcriptional regulator
MVDDTPRRNTRQRQVVLEELRKFESHPTAAEVYEVARRRLSKISLGTVYRNLDLLAQMGVIRKIEIVGGEAHFDAKANRHYHVRCVRCGRVDDADGLPDDPLNGVGDAINDYDIVGYRLEFVGVCPECQKTSDGEQNEETKPVGVTGISAARAKTTERNE